MKDFNDLNSSNEMQDLIYPKNSTLARPGNKDEENENTEKAEKTEKHATGPSVEKELFEARIVLISSAVDSKMAHAVNSKLLALERHNEKDPIYLFINSPGGEIQSGFSIFDCARFIRPTVVTVVTGLAASMGSIITLCAKPKHRFAFPNSKILVHQPSIGGLAGSVSDIEIHAKDLLETKDRIINLYVEECGRSPDEVKKALNRDSWMSAEAAVKWGHVSKVITTREDLKI